MALKASLEYVSSFCEFFFFFPRKRQESKKKSRIVVGSSVLFSSRAYVHRPALPRPPRTRGPLVSEYSFMKRQSPRITYHVSRASFRFVSCQKKAVDRTVKSVKRTPEAPGKDPSPALATVSARSPLARPVRRSRHRRRRRQGMTSIHTHSFAPSIDRY